jgi:hypothetical protein
LDIEFDKDLKNDEDLKTARIFSFNSYIEINIKDQ